MPKKSKAKRYKSKKTTKRYVFILWIFIFAIVCIILGYFLGKQDTSNVFKKIKNNELYSTDALLTDLHVFQEEVKDSILLAKEKLKKIELNRIKKIESVKKREKKEKYIVKIKSHKNIKTKVKRPKLVIIIDDVHTKAQIDAIKNLGIKLTPSIFPPYVLSKNTNKLAKYVKHYMIHLPMESGSRQLNTQSKTLMTSFSAEHIAMRVAEIRTLFPNAKYINNHTGSVFTSDYKSMQRLYVALKRKGFIFVDSCTSNDTKVKKITKKFGDRYIKRDIFIDNTHTIEYIHKQLIKAVKKAKKRGYAIAIGHPHKVTMKALSLAKNILKDVRLVYINEI